MLKIMSIDPSGTGTTGICLIIGLQKIFFQFISKKWQEHYQYILKLVQEEKPQLVLLETAYYEANFGTKHIMDLQKLVGALEMIPWHLKTHLLTCQNVQTKKQFKLIKDKTKEIPDLTFQGKKWKYKEQEISQHQVDALIIYLNYERNRPYIN